MRKEAVKKNKIRILSPVHVSEFKFPPPPEIIKQKWPNVPELLYFPISTPVERVSLCTMCSWVSALPVKG